jgi:hypothetical protein
MGEHCPQDGLREIHCGSRARTWVLRRIHWLVRWHPAVVGAPYGALDRTSVRCCATIDSHSHTLAVNPRQVPRCGWCSARLIEVTRDAHPQSSVLARTPSHVRWIAGTHHELRIDGLRPAYSVEKLSLGAGPIFQCYGTRTTLQAELISWHWPAMAANGAGDGNRTHGERASEPLKQAVWGEC